jgi:protein SCO1/2
MTRPATILSSGGTPGVLDGRGPSVPITPVEDSGRATRPARGFATSLALVAALAGTATASDASKLKAKPDSILDRVRFDQKQGATLPLDLTFRDEAGRAVKLGDFFGKRPVILDLVYYRCPTLCNLGLNGLARGLKPLTPTVGKEFEVVTVSIDPNETPGLAAAKKASYLELYGRPGAERGWHFLTGDAAPIAALADAVGFRYTYNPASKQFAHPAGYMIVTPSGKLSRYIFGIEPSPRDIQAAVAEAGQEKVGAASTWLPLLCYDYDAATGKYTLSIVRVMRLAGTATALGLASFVFLMFRRERRGAVGRARPEPPAPQGPGDLPPPAPSSEN